MLRWFSAKPIGAVSTRPHCLALVSCGDGTSVGTRLVEVIRSLVDARIHLAHGGKEGLVRLVFEVDDSLVRVKV